MGDSLSYLDNLLTRGNEITATIVVRKIIRFNRETRRQGRVITLLGT